MQQSTEQAKTYTISNVAALLGAVRRVLPDAIPPVFPAEEQFVTPASPAEEQFVTPASPAEEQFAAPVLPYGWITGACASPSKGDHYAVEFVGKREFRIQAYLDRFGRVFTTSEPLVSPPAREPDLMFSRFEKQPVRGEERGCVKVRDARGEMRQVAQYVCVRNRYTFKDSWFNFGPMGSNLSYDDALARAYAAFVVRPQRGGSAVPARGLDFIHEHLRSKPALAALRAIVAEIRRVRLDPVVQPPALACCLVRWLAHAGFDALPADLSEEGLRLVRTTRYANTFYLAADHQKTTISSHTAWAIESALNRFLLIEEAFGDQSSCATEIDCARWDAYLIESAAAQPLLLERPALLLGEAAGGEWDVRCCVATAIERLKLPVRIETQMRLDCSAGFAAVELTVPDATLMPRECWFDNPQGVSGWAEAPASQRDTQARRYALRFGLVLAALMFEASPLLQRVEVVASPLEDEKAESQKQPPSNEAEPLGEFPQESNVRAYVQVTLSRQQYESAGRFRAAIEGDPGAFYVQSGAVFDLPHATPFSLMEALPSAALRKLLPEKEDRVLVAGAQALGVRRTGDLRISFDGHRRHLGERLADRIALTQSTTEAIRGVREEQEAAAGRNDDLDVAACTRLMAALAHGSLDTKDQNAVVSCFLGEDRCMVALGRAYQVAQQNSDEAVSILMDSVAEAAALEGFVDGAHTVYRSFDSYAARVLYEHGRSAVGPLTKSARPSASTTQSAQVTLSEQVVFDAGKRVQLVSDSFFLCHLEIVSLLERSFDRIDEALRFGRRAIELAPATTAGYRQLGRAYMLMGDMDNAATVLESCLRIAVQPAEIAVIYYQLGYALWRSGKPKAGAACYLKSIVLAPVVALQAVSELKELSEEHGIEPIDGEGVDEALAREGIVIAPTDEVLEVLGQGAAAAVDEGIFPVARNLLSVYLHYRSDDALVSVLRSLED